LLNLSGHRYFRVLVSKLYGVSCNDRLDCRPGCLPAFISTCTGFTPDLRQEVGNTHHSYALYYLPRCGCAGNPHVQALAREIGDPSYSTINSPFILRWPIPQTVFPRCGKLPIRNGQPCTQLQFPLWSRGVGESKLEPHSFYGCFGTAGGDATFPARASAIETWLTSSVAPSAWSSATRAVL